MRWRVELTALDAGLIARREVALPDDDEDETALRLAIRLKNCLVQILDGRGETLRPEEEGDR